MYIFRPLHNDGLSSANDEQHAASDLMAETQNQNIRNSTNNYPVRIHTEMLHSYALCYWQCSTLFTLKYKQKLHLAEK